MHATAVTPAAYGLSKGTCIRATGQEPALTGGTPDSPLRMASVPATEPTALLRSVARLNNVAHWTAGNTCNIKFPKTLFGNEAGLQSLKDLITAYMELGGQQVQINVVDAETLRNAKAHPEQHEDLIVRVAGFSAYFTTLSPDVQDEIISRTEHSI